MNTDIFINRDESIHPRAHYNAGMEHGDEFITVDMRGDHGASATIWMTVEQARELVENLSQELTLAKEKS